MTAPAGSTRRRTWRGWGELSRVEHVGLYTRLSLYFVLLATNAFVLLAATDELDSPGQTAPLFAGGAALSLLGIWAMRRMVDEKAAGLGLPRRPLGLLLAGSAVYLAVPAIVGPEAAFAAAVLVAGVSLCLVFGLLPDGRVASVLVLGGGVVAGLIETTFSAVALGVVVAGAFLFTSRASMWMFGIVRELDDARQAQSELAVMEERLRFSRDVHDVLGRRLSMIAVQAELAATLAQRGDARAPERMLEVREVAHQALREAREIARGYRAADFAQEVEGARALLRSAGIEVEVSVESMPAAWHEPAAWVVREAVTNVLRHSGATVVEIAYGQGRLRVENDAAKPGGAVDGAGLQGLRERLAPLGASLLAEPAAGGRWVVVAELPGAGPLSGRTARSTDA